MHWQLKFGEENDMAGIRVMVADDNAEIRRMICSAVEQQEDMVVAGECGNGLEVLEELGHHQADVLVLDLIMPLDCGACMTRG